MAEIGKLNRLKVIREVGFGVYLDGGELGGILLPKRFVPAGCKLGDEVEVFVYNDTEDYLVATTEKPYVMVGEFASLKVKEKTDIGAFLDWGLPKDLFLPFSEQRYQNIEAGRHCVVYVYLDNSDRLAATARIDRFVDKTVPDYESGQEVSILLTKRTDLGFKAVINNAHYGVIHNADVFGQLRVGMRKNAFIKKVREDGKVDLVLSPLGYKKKVAELPDQILADLRMNDGFSPLNDKASPDEIYRLFNCSKKAYKLALSKLYKERKILIEADGIRLV
ncbi:CvfB family protein [Marinobacterium jannaschii]|uniref:CvfB family protein n=1 Tax=Marinobacterium jannaschii TaxID=64970 RepID=UPI0004829CBA|nr:S1-like domain-containing RNA-binding protein [Marinobacterium jannaschii]